MFYCTCVVLASELSILSNLQEERPNHTILDMGVCTKRSALLALDRTDSSSSRSPLAATRQLVDLDFSVLANPSVDWNPACPDILDLASCGECYNLCHSDILVESQSAGSSAGLLLEVSDCRYKGLYLYGSFESMVLFFEPTTVCGLMCRNWSSGSDSAPPAVVHAVSTV